MRPRLVVEGWLAAMNAHDAERASAWFADDYEDVAPARRGEVVRGRVHVRANFEKLFAGMPDLRVELLRLIDDERTAWMEWSMRGTRPDGTVMEFVGVNVFEVDAGKLRRGRIYTELIRDLGGVDAQVERMTVGSR